MEFNDSFLNRTANKWPRRDAARLEFVVWHETASPNPANPYGTLNYNLSSRVQSSYNYLIARDGTIFHYVDERHWIAYHAGLHSFARGYSDWQVNVHSIGVELDGPNDGTPITPAQRDAMIQLIIYFRDTYGIPFERAHHLPHKEVAPGYKSDPRGFDPGVALQLARDAARRTPTPAALGQQLRQMLYQRVGGAYHPEWIFHQYAKTNKLGVPLKLGLDVVAAGQRYAGESYGRDAIFSPYGRWQTVLRLSQVQNAELYNALTRRVYNVLGISFNPVQAFYTYARQHGIGLPLAESQRLRVPSGAGFATQFYALDMLYTPIANPESRTNWADVRRLSTLLTNPNRSATDAELVTTALQLHYARIGGGYAPDDPLWQAAVQRRAGMPIAPPRTLTIDGQTYNCGIFGADVLCIRQDDPEDVMTLSDLG